MPWLYLPPWGIRVVVLAGAALLGLLVVRALRERRQSPLRRQIVPIVLRCVAIAALLWVALNPTALKPREIEGRATLAVLVDTSYSMSVPDEDAAPRLTSAMRVLDHGGLAALENEFTVDVRSFDKETRSDSVAQLMEHAPDGLTSDLGAALSSVVADLGDSPSQAGILLITDGRATTEGALDAARLALARSVPLWTWCVGGNVPRRDLWIEVPSSEVPVSYTHLRAHETGNDLV